MWLNYRAATAESWKCVSNSTSETPSKPLYNPLSYLPAHTSCAGCCNSHISWTIPCWICKPTDPCERTGPSSAYTQPGKPLVRPLEKLHIIGRCHWNPQSLRLSDFLPALTFLQEPFPLTLTSEPPWQTKYCHHCPHRHQSRRPASWSLHCCSSREKLAVNPKLVKEKECHQNN